MASDGVTGAVSGTPPWECPVCGRGTVSVIDGPVRVDFRDASYVVLLRHEECSVCGEQFFSPAEVDQLQLLAAGEARRERGLLAPDEIRTLRRDLGLSQERLERLLGLGPKTIVRWEKGTVFQSVAADRLLRSLRFFPELLELLAEDGTQRGGKARTAAGAPSRPISGTASLRESVGRADTPARRG
jgi:HTH-type transcriptional regulator/antitoxin MqsA